MKEFEGFVPIGVGIFVAAALAAATIGEPVLGPYYGPRQMFFGVCFFGALVFFYQRQVKFHENNTSVSDKLSFATLSVIFSGIYAVFCGAVAAFLSFLFAWTS